MSLKIPVLATHLKSVRISTWPSRPSDRITFYRGFYASTIISYNLYSMRLRLLDSDLLKCGRDAPCAVSGYMAGILIVDDAL